MSAAARLRAGVMLVALCSLAAGAVNAAHADSTPIAPPPPPPHPPHRPPPPVEQHVADLARTLGGDDMWAAGDAALALAKIGAPAVPAVVPLLAHATPAVRMSAATALGRIGAGSREAAAAVRANASAALVGALDDADANVRAAAAFALGTLDGAPPEAIAALTAHLADSAVQARLGARRALQRLAPQDRARATAPAEVVATIERLVPRLMDELHVPGVSIAVVRDGRLAWSKSFGVVDAASKEPVTKATLFEAASMSKPVLATIAMQLVDARRLDLDRPLVSSMPVAWYPASPEAGRVTARHVLTHTSGLPNWRDGGDEREAALPFLFEPGARYGYSGEAIGWLQRVVEHITGKPLQQQARAALFGPLGMETSSFAWTEDVGRVLATGHDADGKPLPRAKYTHAHAAYTLYTTAEEYATLLAGTMDAARGGSRSPVLSRRSARAMLARQVRADARDPVERPGRAETRGVYYGLGWVVSDTPSGDIASHSGSNGTGFRCFSQFAPSRGSALVVMTNGASGSELWQRLVAAIGDF